MSLYRYEGDWSDGKPYGRGKMTYANGDVYDGEWRDGRFHGDGCLTYANGDVYDGVWEDDNRQGLGEMKYANGDVYDGEWEDDNRKGFGVMKYANGDVYKGYWNNGRRHGKGCKNYANGDEYGGDWKDDKVDGSGIMFYKNSNRYNGAWKDGKYHGEGTFKVFALMRVYEGQWCNNKLPSGRMENIFGVYEGTFCGLDRDGSGKMTYDRGGVYSGEWKHDKRHGKCEHIEPEFNGRFQGKFKGEYKNDLPFDGTVTTSVDEDGNCTPTVVQVYKGGRSTIFLGCGVKGEKHYDDGQTYVGRLYQDVPNGRGKMTYSCGKVYDGEWKAGKRDGRGITTHVDGGVEEALWVNDVCETRLKMKYAGGNVYTGQFQGTSRHGYGIMRYANGDKYEGTWKDDCRDGEGTMEGSLFVYRGQWKSDKRHGWGEQSWSCCILRKKYLDGYVGEWENDKRHGKGQLSFHYTCADMARTFMRRSPLERAIALCGDRVLPEKEGYGIVCSGEFNKNDLFDGNVIGFPLMDFENWKSHVVKRKAVLLVFDKGVGKTPGEVKEEAKLKRKREREVDKVKKRMKEVGISSMYTCLVCSDSYNPNDAVFMYAYMQCGHVCVCSKCRPSLSDAYISKCIYCRKEGNSLLRLYAP